MAYIYISHYCNSYQKQNPQHIGVALSHWREVIETLTNIIDTNGLGWFNNLMLYFKIKAALLSVPKFPPLSALIYLTEYYLQTRKHGAQWFPSQHTIILYFKRRNYCWKYMNWKVVATLVLTRTAVPVLLCSLGTASRLMQQHLNSRTALGFVTDLLTYWVHVLKKNLSTLQQHEEMKTGKFLVNCTDKQNGCCNLWCPEHCLPTRCQPPPLSLFQRPRTPAALPASRSAADRYAGCLCEKQTSYLYFESSVLFPIKLSLFGAEFTTKIPSTLPTPNHHPAY